MLNLFYFIQIVPPPVPPPPPPGLVINNGLLFLFVIGLLFGVKKIKQNFEKGKGSF